MREIKFRALYDHMGGGWKYGMLIYEGDVPRIQEKGTMLFSTCLKGTEAQFTGLKDKKGKDGYHKDIVKSGKKLYIIEWQHEEARFWLSPCADNTGSWQFMDMLPSFEIVGNCYETPELLTLHRGK